MSETKYISSFKDKPLYPLIATANVRAGASTSSAILFTGEKGHILGISTGNLLYTDADGNNYWFQILPDTPRTDGITFAWVRQDVVTFLNAGNNSTGDGHVDYTGNNGNYQLNAIIKNDQLLYKKILVNTEIITKLKNFGIDTSQHETINTQVLTDYKNRQSKIASYIGTTTGLYYNLTLIPGGYLFQLLYDNFSRALSGLGIVWFVPVALTLAATAVVGVIAYETFKTDYERGKVNLQVSDTLNKALQTLTPEEHVKVLTELESQIDDAYNAGKKSGGIGILDYLKYSLYIGGGVLAIITIKKLYEQFHKSPKTEAA